jgi:TRAP-type C4-dicarboxylate transport system permease small subunit
MKNQGGEPGSEGLLARLGRATAAIEDTLLVLMLAAMILLAGSQIVLRNFWDIGLAWGDPLLRVSVLWIGLLGAMAATRDDNHISIDILYRLLPIAGKNISRAITDLFTSVVCGYVAWYGGLLVALEKREESIVFASVPAWITELIIPVGFGVMALRFLTSFVLRLLGKLKVPVTDDGNDLT